MNNEYFQKNKETWEYWPKSLHLQPHQIAKQRRVINIKPALELSKEKGCGKYQGHTKKLIYDTDLLGCTCPSNQEERKPCKHMYKLAVDLGIHDINAILKEYEQSFEQEDDYLEDDDSIDIIVGIDFKNVKKGKKQKEDEDDEIFKDIDELNRINEEIIKISQSNPDNEKKYDFSQFWAFLLVLIIAAIFIFFLNRMGKNYENQQKTKTETLTVDKHVYEPLQEDETEFTYEHHLSMLNYIKKDVETAKQAAEKGEAEKLHKIYILTQAYIDGYESGLFYPESIDDIVTIHKMLGEAKEEFEKSKDISKINDVILFIDDIVDK